MPNYVVSLRDLPRAYEAVGYTLPRAALKRAIHRWVIRTERIAVKDSPFDIGAYIAKWDVEDTPDGTDLVNDAPHASVIEYGRRAGARPPPLQPILEWAQRHANVIILKATGRPIAATKSGKPKATTRFSDVENRDLLRFARALQMAIARRGIPPKFVMRNAVHKGFIFGEIEIDREMNKIRWK